MIKRSWLLWGILGLLPIDAGYAGIIQIADAKGYVHANGALLTQLDTASTGYFSTLGADNFGSFGWIFVNTTGSTLSNVNFFGFLDADIDRDVNTFFNEYGVYVSLSLPAGAPGGAIGATSWQIDEPGFVFGTILNDLAAGSLRNDNFVPSSAPDDVSLALGFPIGDLTPGQTATLTLRLSPTTIGGLQQIDPDSESGFHLNGYAAIGALQEPLPGGVPEPGTWALCAAGVSVLLLLRKR